MRVRSSGEERLLASAGRAGLAMDVRVVDDAGRDVAVGERGEVDVRQPVHDARVLPRSPSERATR